MKKKEKHSSKKYSGNRRKTKDKKKDSLKQDLQKDTNKDVKKGNKKEVKEDTKKTSKKSVDQKATEETVVPVEHKEKEAKLKPWHLEVSALRNLDQNHLVMIKSLSYLSFPRCFGNSFIYCYACFSRTW